MRHKLASGAAHRAAGVVLACAMVGGAQQAIAAGDAASGEAVFKAECAECHSLKQGRNKKGPALFAMMGRQAATQTGFEYSEQLRQTRWVWSEETLRRYLSQPTKTANPGTKMKYDGLTD